MSFPDYIDPIEKNIIGRLIDSALKRNMAISVYDEESPVLSNCMDKSKIEAVTGHTEITQYVCSVEGGGESCWFLLVHGNGHHVISDFTASEAGNEIESEASCA